mgnify:FL=1
MDGNVAVGFEPAVGEATAPDYIVTAVKWKIYFDSVVLGDGSVWR